MNLSTLLQTLMESEAAASCIRGSVRAAHAVRAVDVLQPTLSIVMEGCKTVHCRDGDWQLRPGQMLVLCGGARLDARHQPDARTGRYRVLMIPLCDEVLGAARLLWGTPVPVRPDASAPHGSGDTLGPWIRPVPVADHEAVLQRWGQSLLQGDYAGARAALVSLLITLAQTGMMRLVLPGQNTLSQQVRAHVMAAPAQDWQSRDVEHLLGMSGATLRRHLAAEGTSLRELLAEVRLGLSLDLLYGTRLPLKTVAARVGYRSPDAFVRAFRARFGLEPSQLGREGA